MLVGVLQETTPYQLTRISSHACCASIVLVRVQLPKIILGKQQKIRTSLFVITFFGPSAATNRIHHLTHDIPLYPKTDYIYRIHRLFPFSYSDYYYSIFMASSFDRWEKDPFFNAAEEVQESADRMESTYRTWIHATRDASCPWNCDELGRDLHTALGTAKWQLEEFQRAVRSSYSKVSSEDARNRHQDFMDAIDDKITKVEHLLQESVHSGSKASLPWTRLDEGERDELAMFLSGMPAAGGKSPIKCISRDSENLQLSDKDSFSNCSSNLHVSSGWGLSEAAEEKSHGHRRAASADADIGSWKIAVSDDVQQLSSTNASSGHMHKVVSLSGFLSSMESISKLKWSKNGYRKLKAVNHHQEMGNALPAAELNEGINAYYERSKSCLDNYEECYDKQLHGWYGAIQRQLRRSQYQMQYNRPVQITVWTVILLCLIVLIAFCTM